MIDQISTSEPLSGDPARQAVYSLRGYVYQIWRTVEAWAQLKQGETLYIECAEDFDIVAAESSVAVQIKNTGKPISLGSGDARKAIVNFWRLRKNNPNVASLHFRFLTRGAINHERDNRFDERSGIETWRAAAAGDLGSIELLKVYLSEQLTSEAEIAEFLRSGNAQELRDKFFAPFEWVTDESDVELVEESVKRLLIARGDQLGIPPIVCIKALDGLLTHCFAIAQREKLKQRNLTREDFLLVFDEKTSISIPQTSEMLVQFAQALSPGGFTHGGGLSMRCALPNWRSEPPPLPEPVLLRPKLVALIQSGLGQQSPLLIAGTVGKGKTTLAKLVAAAHSNRCLWIELTGREASYVEETLTAASQSIDEPSSYELVVVDDLDVEAGLSHALWTGLELLNRACRRRGKLLLLTAKGVPEDRIDGRLKGLGTKFVPVPDFDSTEIETFFSEMGCPTDERLAPMVSFTMVYTGGHPKLVHLRALELKDQNWPPPSANDLAKIPASIGEQRAIERLDASKRVHGPALEYLYLLSLVTLPFNRELALGFASHINGLTEPGNCFDLFVGRWIEKVGENRFRITSLLSNEAKNAWDLTHCSKAHGEIFDTYFAREGMDVSEAFSVFTHALLSDDQARILSMIGAALSSKDETFHHLAKNLRLLLFFGKGIGSFVLPKQPGASLMLRLLQFRIAEREESEELGRISHEWMWEIDQTPAGEFRDMNRYMRALVVAGSVSASVTPHDAIACLHDIVNWVGRILIYLGSRLLDCQSRFDIHRGEMGQRTRSPYCSPWFRYVAAQSTICPNYSMS